MSKEEEKGLAATFTEILMPCLLIRQAFPGVDVEGKVEQNVLKLQLPGMGWEIYMDGEMVRARHPASGARVEDRLLVKVLELIKEKSSPFPGGRNK